MDRPGGGGEAGSPLRLEVLDNNGAIVLEVGVEIEAVQKRSPQERPVAHRQDCEQSDNAAVGHRVVRGSELLNA